jgi:hypothetical protein
MRHTYSALLICALFAGGPMLAGCDNDKPKVVHESDTKTTNPNTGSSTVDKQKTTVDKNGNKTTTTEHHTDTNNNP